MKKRILTAALLAVALFTAWMLWPRPLATEFDAGRQFAASVTTTGVQNGTSWTDSSEQYDLEGSAALQEVLEGYSYHLCWGSLLGENAIDGKGGSDAWLYINNNASEQLISNGTSRIFLNHRVVKVGYLGNRRGAALNQELLDALRKA